MANFEQNTPISCYCGYAPVNGRESQYEDRFGNIVHECKWICPRCLQLVRSDERIEEKQPTENK